MNDAAYRPPEADEPGGRIIWVVLALVTSVEAIAVAGCLGLSALFIAGSDIPLEAVGGVPMTPLEIGLTTIHLVLSLAGVVAALAAAFKPVWAPRLLVAYALSQIVMDTVVTVLYMVLRGIELSSVLSMIPFVAWPALLLGAAAVLPHPK